MRYGKLTVLFRTFIILSILCNGAIGYSPNLNLSSPCSPNKTDLPETLVKTADYCERLKDIALHFICIEDVEERIYHPFRRRRWMGGPRRTWKTEENKYQYDYQLFRKAEVQENRVLKEQNGDSIEIKDAPLLTKRFSYKNAVFGPIGLFSTTAQETYDYSIEDEKTLWGIDTLVIRAVPKDIEKSTRLYGKAWVDKSTGSILKIEWEETSLRNYKGMEEFAKKVKGKPSLKFVTEYGIEKNGIRFPSKCQWKEDYLAKQGIGVGFHRLEKSELLIKYKEYKFFIVETEIKY